MKILEARFRIFDIIVRIVAVILCVFVILFFVTPCRKPAVTREEPCEIPVALITPPSADTLDLLQYCCEKPYHKDWACCPYCGTHLRHNRFERHLLRLGNDPDYARRWEVIEERLARERGDR